MKGARTPAGYTIIEVMIVLAVSGVMFLIAADFIGGKQETTTFTQGVNELAANLQNTIAQVSDGQYTDIDFTCTFTYGGQSSTLTILPSTAPTGTDTQGTQSPCIFLGKVDQFNREQYQTFSLAGGRVDNSGNPITADASNPTTPLDNDAPTPISYLTVQTFVPEHLDIKSMGVELTATNPPNSSYLESSSGIGFLQDLGTVSQSGAQNGNGAQPIELYYVSLLGPASPPSAINGSTLTLVPAGQEVLMCVTDYTRYAYIEIGSANNQLGVRVDILEGSTC